MQKRKCDYCHCDLKEGVVHFEIKLEMYATPTMPDITPDDLNVDHTDELQELIEAMEDMDPDELTDEVYECYIFTLCKQCRDEIHYKLKHNKDKKQPI